MNNVCVLPFAVFMVIACAVCVVGMVIEWIITYRQATKEWREAWKEKDSN